MYSGILRKKAEEFITRLSADAIKAELIEDSFREYNVKLLVNGFSAPAGKINIYYSPKKKSFRMLTNEIKDSALSAKIENIWDEKTAILSRAGYSAYVDGSYLSGKTGYGAVILKDSSLKKEICGTLITDDEGTTRQIAGEIEAVKQVLSWCMGKGVKSITVFYDYKGLEMWPRGIWQAKKNLTREYAEFVRASGVNIIWQKVAAHSGNKWNEAADKLAKKGAGVKAKG